MKRVLLLPTLPFLGLSALGVVQLAGDGPVSHRRPPSESVVSVSFDGAITTAEDRSDELERAEVRRQLRRREAGTYIGEILRARDSALARWPDRRGRPLKVWIQPAPAVADWSPAYTDRVRAAFGQWNELRLPVFFSFAGDSASADVHVNWIDHFEEPISGRTKWARDDGWWITDADIVLAVHHHGGELLDHEAMKAMALHEIGHLLGLDHTEDAGSIMASKVRVRELSPADVATARLLYTLPPGAVR